MDLAKELESLQPFGMGNPQPVFLSQAQVVETKTFGKTNNHLKLYVKNPDDNSYPLEMIAFSGANLIDSLKKGTVTDIAYSIEIDRWRGDERLRGKIIFPKS